MTRTHVAALALLWLLLEALGVALVAVVAAWIGGR